MKNILVRKAKPSDAEGFVNMWNEGIKRKFFVYNGTNKLRNNKDISKTKKKYSSHNKIESYFIAVDTDNKKIVGSCSFHGTDKGRTRHRVELGWVVHPDYAGKGIATKLVDAVLKEAKKRGFKRAEAEAALENIPSVKLAKRFGFSIEGVKKKGLLLDDGRYVDTYIFGKIIN